MFHKNVKNSLGQITAKCFAYFIKIDQRGFPSGAITSESVRENTNVLLLLVSLIQCYFQFLPSSLHLNF